MLFAASAAAAPNPSSQGALDETVRYLQEAQQGNGGFGAAGEPSQISSAWAALALAAAGINPRDQRRPGGVDAYAYLVSHYRQGIEESECAPIPCTTTFERELMVANASGTNPRDFGGVDLVGELLARAGPDGSFPHVPGGRPGVNDTIFAVFALAPVPQASALPVQRAADWVESAQHDNGGWAWSATGARDEVDMTGAAIQALVAAGRSGSAAVREGLAYLHAAQDPDGGFPEFPGNPESNVASTAWAAQAIWAAGENPEDWLTGSGLETEEPLDYLESLQQADGHIRWKRSQDLNGVWMTAYVAPAFAGQPWPIPAAPRAVEPPPSPPRPGQGAGTQSGAGVIAGGGGRGAPLFSRPRPQSRGRTPGGARAIRDQGAHAANHSESRRGDNARQPEGTAVREASDPETATPAIAGSGGPGAVPGGGRGGSGDEVTGTLVGTGTAGSPFFGAPGLHGAGSGAGGPPWAALGIGAMALLAGLLGAWVERRGPNPVLGAPA